MHQLPKTQKHGMRLAFLTRFSESCFEAIPAIAQWMDDISSSLTIFHVYNPRRVSRGDAQAQLNAFFAEADRYGRTQRVLLEGDKPAHAVASYLDSHPHDLLLCPASDRIGFPRPWHRSTRAQLLHLSQAPLWTVGARQDSRRSARSVRVGCLVSRRSDSRPPLQLAAHYAHFHGAVLQLMYVVPEVDEGSLRNALDYDEPLSEPEAKHELRRLASVLSDSCEVFTATGLHAHSIRDMLDRAQTDVLFLGKQLVLRRKLWMPALAEFLDSTGCPVICVDHDRARPLWDLRCAQTAEAGTAHLFARR